MATVGSVLQRGENIYLVTRMKENGGVEAQLCASKLDSFYPVPGVTLHLSPEGLEKCRVLGVAEVI